MTNKFLISSDDLYLVAEEGNENQLVRLWGESQTVMQQVSNEVLREIGKFWKGTVDFFGTAGTNISNFFIRPKEEREKQAAKRQEMFNQWKANTKQFVSDHKVAISFAVGALSGLTVALLFSKLHADQPALLGEQVHLSNRIEDYAKIAHDNPSSLSTNDWRAYVSNISARLETDLRTVLNHSYSDSVGLKKLLLEAERNDTISADEASLLDDFRDTRNRLIHDNREFTPDPTVVQGTVDFINMFESLEVVEVTT